MRTPSTARRIRANPAGIAAGTVRALGRLAVGVLLGFHVWLLGAHLLDGRVFEPATAVRWVISLVVVAGFRALSRRGLPLLVDRRAVGLWLVVVIIHCSAGWDGRAAASLERAIPESVTALAQLSVTALVLGATLAAALVLWRCRRTQGGLASAAPALFGGLPASGFVFRISPRPPPSV